MRQHDRPSGLSRYKHQVVCGRAVAHAAVVLTECDIQHPMERILHRPMRTDRLAQRRTLRVPAGRPDCRGNSTGSSGWECQKPGALCRELDCVSAKPPIQHCGPDLKHAMGAAGRPAHLPSLVHARVDQLIDGVFRT